MSSPGLTDQRDAILLAALHLPQSFSKTQYIRDVDSDDVIFLNDSDMQMTSNSVSPRQWQIAEFDHEILVNCENYTPSQSCTADVSKLNHHVSLHTYEGLAERDSDVAKSDPGLQYLLDQLPAPGAQENSFLSDLSSHSIVQPPCISSWHFSAAHNPLDIPRETLTRNQDAYQQVVGLQSLEALQTLVRARDNECKSERAKVAEYEAACKTAHSEIENQKAINEEWARKFNNLSSSEQEYRQKLDDAKIIIDQLNFKIKDLRGQLVQSHSMIEELQSQIRDLRTGEAVISSDKYEQHLTQIAEKQQAELANSRQEKDKCRFKVSELTTELESLRERLLQQSDTIAFLEQSRETQELPQFQKSGNEILLATIQTLESEIKMLHARRDVTLGLELSVGPDKVSTRKKQSSVMKELKEELKVLHSINEQLVQSNRRLISGNTRKTEDVEGKTWSLSLENAGDETENLHLLNQRITAQLEISESENKRLQSEMFEAVESAKKHERLKSIEVEQENRRKFNVELENLRSACAKSTAESVRMVEERCSKELEAALTNLQEHTVPLHERNLKDASIQTVNEWEFAQQFEKKSEGSADASIGERNLSSQVSNGFDVLECPVSESVASSIEFLSLSLYLLDFEIDPDDIQGYSNISLRLKDELSQSARVEQSRIVRCCARSGTSWIDITLAGSPDDKRSLQEVYEDIKHLFAGVESAILPDGLLCRCVAMRLSLAQHHTVEMNVDLIRDLCRTWMPRDSANCEKMHSLRFEEQNSYDEISALQRASAVDIIVLKKNLRDQMRNMTSMDIKTLRKEIELDRLAEAEQVSREELIKTKDFIQCLRGLVQNLRDQMLVRYCRDLRRFFSDEMNLSPKNHFESATGEESASISLEEIVIEEIGEKESGELRRLVADFHSYVSEIINQDLQTMKDNQRDAFDNQKLFEKEALKRASDDLHKLYQDKLKIEEERLQTEALSERRELESRKVIEQAKFLKDLREKLSKERREASKRLIEEAIDAASKVRNQTQAILREALEKEIACERKVHMEQCCQVRGILNAEYRSLIQSLQDTLKEKYESEVKVVQKEAEEATFKEKEKAIKDMKIALESELEVERERLHMEYLNRKEILSQESESRIVLLQAQLAEQEQRIQAQISNAKLCLDKMRVDATLKFEGEKALIESEHQEALQRIRVDIVKQAEDLAQASIVHLTELAKIDVVALETHFSCELSKNLSVAYHAGRRGITSLMKNLVKEQNIVENRELGNIQSRLLSKHSDALLRLEEDCALQKAKLLHRLDEEITRERQSALNAEERRLKLEMDNCLRREELRLQSEYDQALEKLREEKAISAQQALEESRKKGQEALEYEIKRISEQFEQELASNLLEIQSELKAKLGRDLINEGRRLDAESVMKLSRLHDENREELRRMECRLQEQLALEATERQNKLQEKLFAENERSLEALKRKAQVKLDQDTRELEIRARNDLALARDELERQLTSQLSLEFEHIRLEAAKARKNAEMALEGDLIKDRDAKLNALQAHLDNIAEEELQGLRSDLEELRHSRLSEEKRRLQTFAVVQEEELRAKLSKEAEESNEKLRHELSIQREKALRAVEIECEAILRYQTEQLRKESDTALRERLALIRSEHSRNLVEQEERIRLRSSLELARELAALRAECSSDLDRCRAVLRRETVAEVDAAASAMISRHAKALSDAAKLRTSKSESESHELLRVARNEWYALIAHAKSCRKRFDSEVECENSSALKVMEKIVTDIEDKLAAVFVSVTRRWENIRLLPGYHSFFEGAVESVDSSNATLSHPAERKKGDSYFTADFSSRNIGEIGCCNVLGRGHLESWTDSAVNKPAKCEEEEPVACEVDKEFKERIQMACQSLANHCISIHQNSYWSLSHGHVDIESKILACLMSLLPKSLFHPNGVPRSTGPKTPSSVFLSLDSTIAADSPRGRSWASRESKDGSGACRGTPRGVAHKSAELDILGPKTKRENLLRSLEGPVGRLGLDGMLLSPVERVPNNTGCALGCDLLSNRQREGEYLVAELEYRAHSWSTLYAQVLHFAIHSRCTSSTFAAKSHAPANSIQEPMKQQPASKIGTPEAREVRSSGRGLFLKGSDRDRQLYNMLRRSSTRRSLAKSFIASVTNGP